MSKVKVFRTLIRRTEGSVAVITALGLVAFLGIVSLAIDMGHLYTAGMNSRMWLTPQPWPRQAI